MSETVIFCIGAVVFALVVYGTVMAGGMFFAEHLDTQDAYWPHAADAHTGGADLAATPADPAPAQALAAELP
jgi:hypothetical protein